ncbi:MAG TPA: large conductance mechanosensitive channel protein MscL [Chloroflexus aurantiacus]|uniref:Large-conductance mechanosensitive channel n=1 Tax=Chloroflexus aurantiacus (strain ATCC 29366 / DSM 635 / J-10-fl) TaxID=324602 RepID=MSCL_CHLAA|nr:large conductance mechanosensitive channel protein MscL [Chloroflexus aurantiacus]A9WJI9.1 RecName: Full=Large-conductance mechanosensitive channel [Chloroflexus aurantiacus J-10-fl]ABY35893.1 large conductance mechanosensitive channel protein [Chloroflexus aurantiacus J-10-fl]HBW69239.1 large conductance mechanosensitive channel protein MscL [Chloroflexus aurantiacus]
MIKEFREFISRGNVIDLAVGVIVGAAFTAIINSLVNDIINPLIGLLVGGRADFSNYFIPLAGQTATTLAEAQAAGPVLAYGSFLTAVINFLLIAFVVFMIVRTVNRMRSKPEAVPPAPPEPTPSERLLAEIRDLLARQG